MKKGHKKLNIILIVSSLIVIFSLLLLRWVSYYPDSRYKLENIQSVRISMDYSLLENIYQTNTFEVKSEYGIQMVLESLKNMKTAPKYKLNDPVGIRTYTYTYFFKDGKIKTVHHTVPPSTFDDPMGKLLSSEEVIRQIQPIFHVNAEEISSIRFFYIDAAYKKHEKVIEEIKYIPYLIETGRSLYLEQNIGQTKNNYVTIQLLPTEKANKPACLYRIDMGNEYINKMRNEIPELDKFLNDAMLRRS